MTKLHDWLLVSIKSIFNDLVIKIALPLLPNLWTIFSLTWRDTKIYFPMIIHLCRTKLSWSTQWCVTKLSSKKLALQAVSWAVHARTNSSLKNCQNYQKYCTLCARSISDVPSRRCSYSFNTLAKVEKELDVLVW